MTDATTFNNTDWLIERASLVSGLRSGARGIDDDWWKKSRRSAPLQPPALRTAFRRDGAAGTGETHVEMRHRFERLAGGAQPAVIKILAFGGGSATNRVASYISRDGQIPLENENGVKLVGRHTAEAVKEWTPLQSGAEKTRDLAVFTANFIGQEPDLAPVGSSLSALHQAFEGRSFAASIHQIDAETRIKGVVVLNLPGKGRLESNTQAGAKIEDHLRETLGGHIHQLSFQYGRHGHGVRFAGSELRKLVEMYPGQVFNEHGVAIGNAGEAGQLAQRDWRSKLESRGPRDHIHLLISAPSQASKPSFEAAVRQFLFSEFGGHRYLFAIHDPIHDPKSEASGGKRPHLHAHALIATRSNYGERLKVWVTDLNHWRTTFSQCARDQGLAIEATHRHETLQAPAYGYKGVRPVSFVGRTQHVGTSAAAQQRYDDKRSQKPHIDNSAWAKSQAQLTRIIWEEIASQASTARAQAFAEHMLRRFDGIDRALISDQAPFAATSKARDRAAEPWQLYQSREKADMATRSRPGPEERDVTVDKKSRRHELLAGTSQSNTRELGMSDQGGGTQLKYMTGLASALRTIVGSMQTRRTEPELGASETHKIEPGPDHRAGSKVNRGGEPMPQQGLASKQYKHIDLSQQPRHPAPDPAIEATDHSVLARQARGRTEDQILKQHDRDLNNGRSSRERGDDKIYGR